MKIKNRLNLLYIPIALSLAATLLFYSRLPDMVPTHWNAAGEIDTYKPRYFVFLTGLLPALFVFLFTVIPSIDPKSENYKKHEKAYSITALFLVLFLIAVHWFAILAAMGKIMRIDILIRVLVGVLFIIIGNYLPQARQNYTYGIRTPWTLDNVAVWKKTQRVGGIGFVICGLIIILSVFLSSVIAFWIVIVSVVSLILLIFVYSYVLYNRLDPDKEDE